MSKDIIVQEKMAMKAIKKTRQPGAYLIADTATSCQLSMEMTLNKVNMLAAIVPKYSTNCFRSSSLRCAVSAASNWPSSRVTPIAVT